MNPFRLPSNDSAPQEEMPTTKEEQLASLWRTVNNGLKNDVKELKTKTGWINLKVNGLYAMLALVLALIGVVISLVAYKG